MEYRGLGGGCVGLVGQEGDTGGRMGDPWGRAGWGGRGGRNGVGMGSEWGGGGVLGLTFSLG